MACGQEARSVTPGRLAVQAAPTLYAARNMYMTGYAGATKTEGEGRRRGNQPRQRVQQKEGEGEGVRECVGRWTEGRGRAIIPVVPCRYVTCVPL